MQLMESARKSKMISILRSRLKNAIVNILDIACYELSSSAMNCNLLDSLVALLHNNLQAAAPTQRSAEHHQAVASTGHMSASQQDNNSN